MTAVLPDLDAETVEELRPPCDVKYHHPNGSTPCERPATWVSRIRCDNCGSRYDGFQCDYHKAHFFDRHGEAVCVHCRMNPMPYTCLSVERL